MLRVLIGSGVLLMAVGFGAAGWQYWQSLPSVAPVAVGEGQVATRPEAPQPRLVSPTGEAIPQDEVRAYLAQDRFAPRRTVEMILQANLADLLADGERLPEVAYLQVLADIRAPRLAEGLCAVMRPSFAADCAVNAARVVEGSVDPATGTAMFRIELVYRLDAAADEMPDLSQHVLRKGLTLVSLDAGTPGTESAEAALQVALATATEACAAEGVGQLCRPMRIAVEWRPGEPAAASVDVAWLSPLPEGLFPAPPLQPLTD